MGGAGGTEHAEISSVSRAGEQLAANLRGVIMM
jgi:hypothetical protein